ncbi:hypothetical protein IWW50_000325, partial [Coemansia erecta]
TSAIDGHPSNQTDFFVRDAVTVAAGDSRESLVAVEFKSLQGAHTWKAPLVCGEYATGDERTATSADMVSVDFLRRALSQLHRDVRDRRRDAPRFDRRLINRQWALLSSFNETWVVRFEDNPDSLKRREEAVEVARRNLRNIRRGVGPTGTSGAAETVAAAQTGTGGNVELDSDFEKSPAAAKAVEAAAEDALERARVELDRADYAYVSNCFCADNTRPHVAAAVAYVAEQVAADMVDNPDDYIKVGGQQHQGGRQDMPTVSRTRKRKRAAGTSSRTGTHMPRDRGRGRGGADLESVLADWGRLPGDIVVGKLLWGSPSGAVFAGTMDGEPAALKISHVGASAKILLELAHEVAIYNYLVDFQGGEVARLYDHGICNIDGTARAVLVLDPVTNILKTAGAEGYSAAQLPLPMRRQVMCVLDTMHEHSVIHGNPRMANILIEPAGVPGPIQGTTPDPSPLSSPVKVRFVDLAFADIDQDKEALDRAVVSDSTDFANAVVPTVTAVNAKDLKVVNYSVASRQWWISC